MADISAEIAAFRNAVYGEDVRSSMISLANKVNNESSAAATTVTGYGERLSAVEADGYVTTAKLANGAVSTDKLANGSVTLSKLGNDIEITPPDGSITDAKLVQSGGVLERVDNLESALEQPFKASADATTAYTTVTAMSGLELKAGIPYKMTCSFKDSASATEQAVYCRLRHNSSQLAQVIINRINQSLSTIYTPAVDITDVRIDYVIGSTSSIGKIITCVLEEQSENALERMKSSVDALTEIVGYDKSNLLNYQISPTTTYGVQFTPNEDKSVNVVGTATGLAFITKSVTLPAGKYIVSGCVGGGTNTYHILLARADNTYVYQVNKPVNFSVSAESETVTVYIRVSSGITVDTVFYPMICPESTRNYSYVEYGEYQIYKPIQDLINYTELNWSGKKMNVIGDSIVQGSYGNFIKPIRRILCLSEARNYGVGGSCLASSSADASYPPAVLRYTSMDLDAQIIIVHAGTNDYSAQIPLGDADSTDITTFNGALNTMMAGLRDMYPTALIIFDSILHRFNDGALTIKASQYRQCIENRCLANHIVFYDSYRYTGFDFVKGYYDHILTSDGLHPNQTGADILGRKLAGFILWN